MSNDSVSDITNDAHDIDSECLFSKTESVVVPYCYLFLLSVFILRFSYYVSDIFCKF